MFDLLKCNTILGVILHILHKTQNEVNLESFLNTNENSFSMIKAMFDLLMTNIHIAILKIKNTNIYVYVFKGNNILAFIFQTFLNEHKDILK